MASRDSSPPPEKSYALPHQPQENFAPAQPETGREVDRLSVDIPCLDARRIPFTLVSTSGFHCEVWRSAGSIVSESERVELDFVLKRHLRPCTYRQAKVLQREYTTLRCALGEMIPQSTFLFTDVNGEENVVALCETCAPWFDLANPGNEDEALHLLSRAPRALADLSRFTETARVWYEREDRLVDLFGKENLVIDRSHRVRYIDSFHVFLYTDVLHTLAEIDPELELRRNIGVNRLEYLERMVQAVGVR